MNSFWLRGEKAGLARLAKIRQSHLQEILNRTRGVSPLRAFKLESAGCIVLGGRRAPQWSDWAANRISSHPAFTGRRWSLRRWMGLRWKEAKG